MSVKQLLLLCGCSAGEVATIGCVGHCRLTQELAAEKLKSEQVKLDCQQQSARDLAEMEQQMTQAIQEAQASKALACASFATPPVCLRFWPMGHDCHRTARVKNCSTTCACGRCQATCATHTPTRPAACGICVTQHHRAHSWWLLPDAAAIHAQDTPSPSAWRKSAHAGTL